MRTMLTGHGRFGPVLLGIAKCQMLALSSFCHPISYTLNRHLDHHLGQTLICTSLKEGHGETSVWCWFQQSLLSQDLRGWGG